MKRITVKITKNIYYFFRYAYRFNLQIHTQVAPARERGGENPPLVRKRPAAHGPRVISGSVSWVLWREAKQLENQG